MRGSFEKSEFNLISNDLYDVLSRRFKEREFPGLYSWYQSSGYLKSLGYNSLELNKSLIRDWISNIQ